MKHSKRAIDNIISHLDHADWRVQFGALYRLNEVVNDADATMRQYIVDELIDRLEADWPTHLTALRALRTIRRTAPELISIQLPDALTLSLSDIMAICEAVNGENGDQ